MKKEFSAGGIVFKDGKVLCVLMNTINGEKVWTFPKGHIEENETKYDAALREVFEETGVKCEIIDKNEFYISHYFFTRDNHKVEKKVFWYLMKPLEITNEILTPCEIEEIRWYELDEAKRILKYKSDLEIIDKLKKYLEEKNGI